MMAFRVMDHFRIPTLRELDGRLTADDLDWWAAYQSLEGPLGSVRDDIRTASICQVVAASQGVRGTLKEYLLQWRPKPPTTYEQIEAFFAGIAARQAK